MIILGQGEWGKRKCFLERFGCSVRLWLKICLDQKIICRHIYQRRQWHPTPAFLPGKSHGRRSLVGYSPWGHSSRTRLSDFTFTFHFHALEKKMATHSSVLAWRIPGTGDPGGLWSVGSHRVGHDWSNLTAAVADTYTYKATPIWSSPGQNTAVGSLSLLQGIFPTQGSSPGLPHCRQITAEPQELECLSSNSNLLLF